MRMTFAISISWLQSNVPTRISVTRVCIRPWNGVGACLNRSAGIPEEPGALSDVILFVNANFFRNVCTRTLIVSPSAVVRKLRCLLYPGSICSSIGVLYSRSLWGPFESSCPRHRSKAWSWFGRVVLRLVLEYFATWV